MALLVVHTTVEIKRAVEASHQSCPTCTADCRTNYVQVPVFFRSLSESECTPVPLQIKVNVWIAIKGTLRYPGHIEAFVIGRLVAN